MSQLWDQLAVLCTVAGLSAGLAVGLATRRVLLAIRVAVDFWVAAGLIRLSGDVSWQALLGAAGILALRQLLHLALCLSPLHDESAHRSSSDEPQAGAETTTAEGGA